MARSYRAQDAPVLAEHVFTDIPGDYRTQFYIAPGHAWAQVKGSVVSRKTRRGAILPVRVDGTGPNRNFHYTLYVTGIDSGN